MEVQTYQFLKFLEVLVVFFCFVWGGGHTLQSSEFTPDSAFRDYSWLALWTISYDGNQI